MLLSWVVLDNVHPSSKNLPNIKHSAAAAPNKQALMPCQLQRLSQTHHKESIVGKPTLSVEGASTLIVPDSRTLPISPQESNKHVITRSA
jgi:hypothetical protein